MPLSRRYTVRNLICRALALAVAVAVALWPQLAEAGRSLNHNDTLLRD